MITRAKRKLQQEELATTSGHGASSERAIPELENSSSSEMIVAKRPKRRKTRPKTGNGYEMFKEAFTQPSLGLLDLSYDVLTGNILPFLDASSLFELRQTSRFFRSAITPFDPDDEKSLSYWNLPIELKEHWNSCKNGVSKRQFARTAFEYIRHVIGCQRCGIKRIRKYYWPFAIRVCVDCLNHITER